MKRMTDREISRAMTRLELRQASEVRDTVRRYLRGRTAADVAAHINMPKTLILQLATDDDGRLFDCILWMRRNQQEHQQ